MTHAQLISQYAPLEFRIPLLTACQQFGITTAQRCAPFLAQCRVESANFTRFEENLNYRTPAVLLRTFGAVRDLADAQRLIDGGPEAIANRVYGGRYGNGDEASGDGWRYRGRGAKQLTFRANYADAARALNRPYVAQPDLVAQPEDAMLTAAWFFASRGCIELADAGEYDEITTKVNGHARLQADVRLALTHQMLDVA